MAFPSSTGSKRTLQKVWESTVDWAARVKGTAVKVRDASAAGLIPASDIWSLDSLLFSARAQFAAAASTPGIAAYAQAQVNDPTLDVAADFTAMVNAIDATRAWVNTNFPVDANGYVLDRTRNFGTADFTQRTFSTAALATYRTMLDALIATID